MGSPVSSIPAICPVCLGSEFKLEAQGFLSKTLRYHCVSCKSLLRQAGGGNSELAFSVERVGVLFSNASGLYMGKQWTQSELAALDDPAYTDHQLLEFAEGVIPPEFTDCGDDLPALPFTLSENESLIFHLENIYSFEERPVGDQVGAGLSRFRVESGGWLRIHALKEPRYANSVETLDTGSLIITNRRYTFTGAHRNIEEPLNRIKSILPFQDGLGIARQEKLKIEYYKGSYHWPLIGAVLTGLTRLTRR